MSQINIETVLEQFSYHFSKEEKDNFKLKLKDYTDAIKVSIRDGETEEHCKTFLKTLFEHYYPSPEYSINTSRRADQTIKKGNELLVLIETKNPNTTAEMPSVTDLNKKGLWELFLYYIENTRTITNGKCQRNLTVNPRTLIVTNFKEFLVFDAQSLDRLISNKVIKFYSDFKNDHLQSSNNQIFYDFAKSYFDEIDINKKLPFVYLDLMELSKTATGQVTIAKILKSYLIKDKSLSTYKPNILNSRFYEELLYIMGLKEIKNGAKSFIELDKTINSSLGNQVYQIMVEQKDATPEDAERKAISLSILWVNRLLFIKLFEGQLIDFNEDTDEYKILSNEKITSFKDIYNLFFNVLGKTIETRGSDAFYNKFVKIPYLNSSLFEKQEIEINYLNIIDLENSVMNLCPKTRIKGVNSEPIVKYIIDFLNSYKFNAQISSDDNLEETRDIIDSSVLGLIFEKINGYKDGSFYTRSEVTEYIAKYTIENLVLEKCQKIYNQTFSSLDDLKYFLDSKEKREQVNNLINELKICDPAVGSGHFLVSALNRILVLKYDLGVLQNIDGTRFSDYCITDIDDIIEVKDPQGNRFKYNKNNTISSLCQETLFNEKRFIIENCLFGVDLNPDAVAICRLRLWIELLKNAYYKNGLMETLPNIDINIKVGNSLISKIKPEAETALNCSAFDDDKMIENVSKYKDLAKKYKHESNKTEKKIIKDSLIELKCDFNPGEEKVDIFGNVIFSLDPLYRNAFEWMFEFPELLDEKGTFMGFDAIIGNPPYGVSLSNEEKKLFKDEFNVVHVRTPDTYRYFISRSLDLIKNNGYLSFIVPNNLLFQIEDKKARNLLINKNKMLRVINLGDNAFSNANVPTCIFISKKVNEDDYDFTYYDSRELSLEETDFDQVSFKISKKQVVESGEDLTIGINSTKQQILAKIKNKSETINDICKEMASGISTGGDSIFKISKEKASGLNFENDLLRNVIVGRDLHSYSPVQTNDVLIYSTKDTNTPHFTNIYNYLLPYQDKLSKKRETVKGLIPWWSLHWPRYEDLFKGKKIIMRQTCDHIIATLDTSNVFVLNSVLVLRLLDEEDYEFVLGVLNSSIGEFVYKNITQEEDRAFAEVKPQNVRKIYVPKNNEIKKDISTIVNECLKIKTENVENDISSQLKLINNKLYEYYELTPEEIKQIEE